MLLGTLSETSSLNPGQLLALLTGWDAARLPTGCQWRHAPTSGTSYEISTSFPPVRPAVFTWHGQQRPATEESERILIPISVSTGWTGFLFLKDLGTVGLLSSVYWVPIAHAVMISK